uniref:E. coli plasmid pIP1527 ereB erythromycin esterase type II n=1 Tax=Escherichia coli TaxID=562 RepID=Q47183_ECOLX|nr:unnamed protein product [Escherichia coli]
MKTKTKEALCPSHNSGYMATLPSAQIGFLRSPTSGTRGTLGAISPRGALALRAAHRAAKKLETNTGGK